MTRYRLFPRKLRHEVTRYRQFPRTCPRELEGFVDECADDSPDAWSFVERIREIERRVIGAEIDLRTSASDIDLRRAERTTEQSAAVDTEGA